MEHRVFGNYAEFHRQAYAASIKDSRDALGVTLLRTSQPAGRWVNASTPDLVIGRCIGGRGIGVADLGSGRFRTSGRVGEAMVMSPGVVTSFAIDAPHGVLIFGLPYQQLRSLDPALELPTDGDFGPLHRSSFEDAPLAGIVDAIWEESAERTPLGLLFLEGAMVALAARLLRLASRPEPVRGGLAPHHLRQALDRLEEGFAGELSLRALAAEAGLSLFHFARAFRASTGVTPHGLQVRLRVARAAELLATTDRSVTAIAQDVGYHSGQALARAFLRETGRSPSAHRRLARA